MYRLLCFSREKRQRKGTERRGEDELADLARNETRRLNTGRNRDGVDDSPDEFPAYLSHAPPLRMPNGGRLHGPGGWWRCGVDSIPLGVLSSTWRFNSHPPKQTSTKNSLSRCAHPAVLEQYCINARSLPGEQGSRAANTAEAVGEVVRAYAAVDALHRLCGMPARERGCNVQTPKTQAPTRSLARSPRGILCGCASQLLDGCGNISLRPLECRAIPLALKARPRSEAHTRLSFPTPGLWNRGRGRREREDRGRGEAFGPADHSGSRSLRLVCICRADNKIVVASATEVGLLPRQKLGLLTLSHFDARVPARIPDQLETILSYQLRLPSRLSWRPAPLSVNLAVRTMANAVPTGLSRNWSIYCRSREAGLCVHGCGICSSSTVCDEGVPWQPSKFHARCDHDEVQRGPSHEPCLPPKGLRKRAQESGGSEEEPILIKPDKPNLPNTWPRMISYIHVDSLARDIPEDSAGSKTAPLTLFAKERAESGAHGQIPVGRSGSPGR
ncbi:hypothetical protein PG991_003562 [Apiospora marii]|uniref:Uncharacterized protein n=1 Tax=Apiospora marii TaxID=335849 RepID=A0ABR1S470_9PEZI